ncbi:hypothetical protein DPMN_066601 [Dreissena polymorpha]|uniref:Uncharacterized protein n=1 Tax=Dreissena polymorpha TaxID=45954 RepID=A0A9D3YUC0_DREPO|nr:hypothetical protein DPMN_066601 [Dreissena polymorpha]
MTRLVIRIEPLLQDILAKCIYYLFSLLNQLRMDVVHSRRFLCCQTAHCLTHHCI